MRGVRYCRKARRVGRANLIIQKRDSKDNPRLKAFCRVAPSVLFSDRAIFPAGVFFRASAFKVRTCSDVHARRFPFSLVIIFPLGYTTGFNNAAGCPRFIQPRQEKTPPPSLSRDWTPASSFPTTQGRSRPMRISRRSQDG